jgi:hypothetical protein
MMSPVKASTNIFKPSKPNKTSVLNSKCDHFPWCGVWALHQCRAAYSPKAPMVFYPPDAI